jgi:hypothetical protein
MFKKFRKPKNKPFKSTVAKTKLKSKGRRKVVAKRRLGSKGKLYQNLAGIVNTSAVSMTHRAKGITRAIKKVGAPNVYSWNRSLPLSSDLGLQNYYSIQHSGNSDLNYIRTKIASTGGDAGARYVLENYQAEITLTNTGNASVEFELYDIVPKRDIVGSYSYNTPGGGVLTFNGTPDKFWENGSRLNANMSAESTFLVPPSKLIGASPMDSQLFRDYFIVKKRTRVILTQGGTHRHEVLVKQNFLVDDALIKMQNANTAGLHGCVSYTMVVQKGLAATYTAAGPPAALGVVLPPTQLAMVLCQRWKYTFVQDNSNNIYPASSLAQTFAEGDTKPQIVNIGSGGIGELAFSS